MHVRILFAFLLALPLAAAEPVRIESAGISMLLPDGWRELEAKEREELRPEMKPQNKWQQKMAEDRLPNNAALVMKHDFAGSTIAASVQALRNQMMPQMKYASSIELLRVLAAGAMATFHGKFEVEPHELTVSGLPGAEFVQRYTLVDSEGSHEMRARLVVVSRGTFYYLVGYAGPAEDSADTEVFNDVLKSLKLAAK